MRPHPMHTSPAHADPRAVRRPLIRAVAALGGLIALLGGSPAMAQQTAPPAASTSASWIQGWDFSFKGGKANQSDVKKYGVVAGYDLQSPLWQGEQWSVRLRHEIEAAGWDVPHAKNIFEVGYTPMFRLQRPISDGSAAFFVEAGIGARLLSHVHTAPDRSLSTAFQFSSELGAGLQFGREGRATVGLRYQHISNAGIKEPNPGMDFYVAYFSYRF